MMQIIKINLVLYFTLTIVFSCCNSQVKNEDVYTKGLKEIFSYIREAEGDFFFESDICLLSTADVRNDIVFSETKLTNLSTAGGLDYKEPNLVVIKKILDGYFDGVGDCKLDSSISVRDNCRKSSMLCMFVSPVYYDENDSKYRFSVIVPPFASFVVYIDKNFNVKVVNSRIK